MIVPVQGGLNQSIETLIPFHDRICSVFTSVRVKIIREGKVNILYQGSLNKSIGKIHLSGITALVDAQAQHESDCIPRDNRGIFFKVIYSLHLSITPCIESGLGFTKSTISKVLDLESPGAWKNVSTSH